MYGFWGGGHTNDLPSPFPDYATAEKTFVDMTRLQMGTWRKTPLAVNTEPHISNVGNRQVQDLAVRSGCWLRSDSLIMDEPVQIEELGNRPPWLAIVREDGSNRHYVTEDTAAEERGCLTRLPASKLVFVGEDAEFAPTDDYPHRVGGPIDRPHRESAGFHALDLGTNYFGLWKEAHNIKRYYEKYPDSLRHGAEARISCAAYVDLAEEAARHHGTDSCYLQRRALLASPAFWACTWKIWREAIRSAAISMLASRMRARCARPR